MSDATVGTVKGYLKLDRSDWSAQLDAAKAEAEELKAIRPDIKVSTSGIASSIGQLALVAAAAKRLQDANEKVSTSQTRLADVLSKGSTDVAYITAGENSLANARERLNTITTSGVASAEDLARAQDSVTRAESALAAIRSVGTATASQKADAESGVTRALREQEVAAINLASAYEKVDKAATDAESATTGGGSNARQRGFGRAGPNTALLTAGLTLGPTLVPIVSAAAFAFGALAVGAGSAYLAISGINAEIAAGTPLGKEYSTGLSVLQSDLAQLKQTAAAGVIAPFNATISQSQQLFPSLNELVGKFATIVGTDAQYAIHGLIGGFTQLEPLFLAIGQGSESLFASFDKYSNGTGLKTFGDYALSVLPQVAATLHAVFQAVVNLAEGLAPLGASLLTGLQLFAEIVAKISPSEITAIATGVVAWVIATRALAAAQGLAATASASSIGSIKSFGVALGAIDIAKYAGIVGIVVALDSITASATHSQSAVGALGSALGALASGNWGGILPALFSATVLPGSPPSNGPLNVATPFGSNTRDTLANFNQGNNNAGANATQGAQVANNNLGPLLSQGATAGIAAYGTSLQNTSASIQKLLDNTNALTDATGNNLVSVGNTQVSQKAWNLALQESNGVMSVARVLIEQAATQGPIYAKALSDVAAEQTKVNAAVTQASKDTGLASNTVQLYASLLGITGSSLASGAVSAQTFSDRIAKFAAQIGTANPAVQGLVSALATFSTSAGTASDRAALMGATFIAAQGDALSFTGAMAGAYAANANLISGFNATEKAAIVTKTHTDNINGALVTLTAGSIDFTKAGAGPLVTALQAMQTGAEAAAEALYQHEINTKGAAQAGLDASHVFAGQTYDALLKDAKQLGLTSGQAQALAKSYFDLSLTPIGADAQTIALDNIATILDQIGSQLSFLTGHEWVIPVTAAGIAAFGATLSGNFIGSTQRKQAARFNAAGGYQTGPGSGTSDSILSWLSNGEYVMKAAAVQRLGVPLLNSLNSIGGPSGISAPAASRSGGDDMANAVRQLAYAVANQPLVFSLDTAGRQKVAQMVRNQNLADSRAT